MALLVKVHHIVITPRSPHFECSADPLPGNWNTGLMNGMGLGNTEPASIIFIQFKLLFEQELQKANLLLYVLMISKKPLIGFIEIYLLQNF